MIFSPPRVHTGGIFFTNGFLLNGPQGNIAIDAPGDMAEWLDRLGVKIDALLITHWHLDHVMDAAEIARKHACPIHAWGPSTPENRLETHLKAWANVEVKVENYPVDHILAGTSEIEVAGHHFRLEHVPGHSPDSVVFVEDAARRVFSGDTLMKDGIGRSDFPDGDGPLLVRGIKEKILTLPGDYEVFSGHGRPTTVQAERDGNPYL